MPETVPGDLGPLPLGRHEAERKVHPPNVSKLGGTEDMLGGCLPFKTNQGDTE